MGCNRDSNCYTIARKVYPELKTDISDSIDKTSVELNEIVDELNTLKIPEDYLGEKVKEKIDEMKDYFTSDISDLKLFDNAIERFINEKINEHEEHYQNWKITQEKKKEEENKQ